ncbi:MAG TPA: molybdate ABC transporter substrate-binding protein [Thermomicrobiales bacterium]|nr:molybdate ABC transporter substrate-binding protein [Thermomicrobiales bacterium]
MHHRPGALTIALVLVMLMTSLASAPSVGAIELTCPPPATPPAAGTPSKREAQNAAFPDDEIELTVFAAASLTDAFVDIADEIEPRHPNVSISVETAGSQTLVTQLGEGAEADVLATASLATMRQAQESGLVNGEPVLFAANRLVIVTPPDNPAGIEGIDDLAGDDIRLVIAAEDVPAGRYARQAICDWAGADDEAVAAIGANVVSEETDVRSALTRVQLDEADAGIVYASDAAAAELAGGEVKVVEFPSDVPTEATYPIAPTVGGNTEAARAFIKFVLSDAGQRILADYGFAPVP